MKLSLTKKFFCLLVAVLLLSTGNIYAQPANDNVCDAIDITGGASGFIATNADATVQMGEEAITPPFVAGCLPGGWCDFTGADGGSGIDNSVWYKFDAPASGIVSLSACISDFDNQLAVYAVGDCNDFGSFTYIWGTDDQADCGVLPDGTAGLASEMTLECLTAGQTYYVLVDGWQDTAGNGVITGTIDLLLTNGTDNSAPVSIDSVDPVAPTCQGGNDGSATAVVTVGPPPFAFSWDNGATTSTITDLVAGTYTVVVTDACGNTANQTVTVDDGPAPAAIVLTSLSNNVFSPTDCDAGGISGNAAGSDGYVYVGVESGTPPFTYTWSNGGTTAFQNGLAAGTYSVTVGDACGNPVATETFVLEAPASSVVDPAGADAQGCPDTQIGSVASSLGPLTEMTYSTNQSDDGNVACSAGGLIAANSYWRAFDMDTDFGLSGAVKVEGVDFILSALAGAGFNGLQPVNFRIYTSDGFDLSTAVLTLLDEVNIQLPDMAGEYFRAPLSATVDASEILVVEINHPGPSEDGHQFAVGANNDTTTQPTYLSSSDCGIGSPTLVTDIGFPQQTIMNVIYRTESTLTYNWDGPMSFTSTEATPTVDETGTYSVTVTDACGATVTDAVEVDICVGIVDPANAAFTIAPNPSQGLFNLQTDIAKDINLEIYDVQGKLLFSEMFNNAMHTVDLSNVANGVYIMKLDDGVNIETHKLVRY